MTCRQVAEFIADYLDGALPEADRGAFEGHLNRCVSCVRYLEGYRRTLACTRDAFGEPRDQARLKTDATDSDIPEELVQAILRSCGRTGPGVGHCE